jgi:hypothetical protein
MSDSLSRRTVLDVIKSVLPDGTDQNDTGWNQVCRWPPDVFAAVATLAERSGLYAEPAFTCRWDSGSILTPLIMAETQVAGKAWAIRGEPPEIVCELWRKLVQEHGHLVVGESSKRALEWKAIVFKLLAISDEACPSVGFVPVPDASAPVDAGLSVRTSHVAYAFLSDYDKWRKKPVKGDVVRGGDLLPYLPHSLCIRVPPEILCVQPKTCAPSVGCTLRSMTHNLALLPSIGVVATHWRIANPQADLSAFNLLIVPFPYYIPGSSFQATAECSPSVKEGRTFAVNPAIWVDKASADDFAAYLIELIQASAAELEPVHAIVLPETALELGMADRVAAILAKRTTLQFFLAGVISGGKGGPRNSAAMYPFADKRVDHPYFQSKHHRWMLDGGQIRGYHLGHVLDPGQRWWEKIDVSRRNCYITLFRARASLSVLVCEDLARYDPVLTVMNAVGPNLVIALLMDGPQLEHRWPGRYATALADDPGSSVLSVTSLGMVRRASMPGDARSSEIALWKEPGGRAQSLKLAEGDHALLLTLTSTLVEQFTLDLRSDGRETVRFGLSAAHGVRLQDPNRHAWLKGA